MDEEEAEEHHDRHEERPGEERDEEHADRVLRAETSLANRSASPPGRGSSTGGTGRDVERRASSREDAGQETACASASMEMSFTPMDTRVKPGLICASSMPILVLLLISLAAGALVFWASRRYPTPVGTPPTDMAEKAAVQIEAEMERHPWLLRLVRGRLDPATATGLALTLALGLAIVGGLLVGSSAYLVRSSDTLVDADRSVGQWGVDNATSWSTDALQLVTELGGSCSSSPPPCSWPSSSTGRVPNRWVPVFLVAVVVGEIILVNTIKELLDRVRPDFYQIAETLGPSFPSGHSGLAAAF